MRNIQGTVATGEIGLGLLMDYVTGCPYIPGSSVKGMLRSAFIKCPEYVLEVLNGILKKKNAGTWDMHDLYALEADCFGRRHPLDHRQTGNAADVKFLNDAVTGKDTFLDVYPIQPDEHGRLLGLDSITPHRAKDSEVHLDGLIDPVPLTLLRIIPGVEMLFRFELKETVLDNGKKLEPDSKLELFKQILMDLGVGAKTNVGYGVLLPVPDTDSKEKMYYLERRDPGAGKEQQNAPGRDKPVSVPQPQTVQAQPLSGVQEATISYEMKKNKSVKQIVLTPSNGIVQRLKPDYFDIPIDKFQAMYPEGSKVLIRVVTNNDGIPKYNIR